MNTIKPENITKSIQEHSKETFSGNFKHISFEDKMQKSFNELIDTNPNDIVKWWWSIWDTLLWWIYWWKIYVVWADSGSWKSTFINQISMNLSRQWVKVTKYSLEDRLEDIWKEELFYISNRILKKNQKKCFDWNWFNNWEYTHSSWKHYNPENIKIIQEAKEYLSTLKITELEKIKKVWIQDLVTLMEEEVERWTKVFFIDHLHYFKMNWNERTDLEIQNIMHDINEIARKHNVSIFLVAHYKKLNWQDPDNDSFKDASAVKQVANVIINIIRRFDTNLTEFHIWKIRWPIKRRVIEARFDLETYTYKDFIFQDLGNE